MLLAYYSMRAEGAPLSSGRDFPAATPFGQPGNDSSGPGACQTAPAAAQAKRMKRRLPAWTSAPASALARHVELATTGSPFDLDRLPGRSAGAPRSSTRRRGARRGAPADAADRRPAAAPPGRRPAPGASRTTRVKCASASRAASSPCERATMQRASSSFAAIGSPSGTGRSATSRHHSGELRVRDPHRPAEHLLRRGEQRDVVADRRAHLRAVPREQERRRQHDLRLEAVVLHHLAAGEQVVELVGAAELDVGLDRDRVVRLHQRVEELRDRDRLAAPPSASRSRRARASARP